MRGRVFFLVVACLLLSFPAFAQEQASPGASGASRASSSGGIIDFEADIIEGERRKPDIFVQMGTQPQTMEGVLFNRKDFNDFHRLDRKWRPGYIEPSRLRPAARPAVKEVR